MKDIAVIVPYYGARDALKELHQRIRAALGDLDWQLILIDDRSPDDGWRIIGEICAGDSRVTALRLSRNFGQHAAITAGMHHAEAKWCVVMDCDLQDRPEDIPLLLEAAEQSGADIAVAKRANSLVSGYRTFGSKMFNWMLAWFSNLDTSGQFGNFRIFSRKVVQAYREYGEQTRYFPALIAQVGFHEIKVDLPRDERPAGRSSYSFVKLFKLAYEVILSYSEKPLQLFAITGATITILSLLGSVLYLTLALFGLFEVPGFASIVILLLFFGGMLTFLISFVGLYTSVILKEVKRRPIYLIDEALNFQLRRKEFMEE